jgi:hypothetical protein
MERKHFFVRVIFVKFANIATKISYYVKVKENEAFVEEII